MKFNFNTDNIVVADKVVARSGLPKNYQRTTTEAISKPKDVSIIKFKVVRKEFDDNKLVFNYVGLYNDVEYELYFKNYVPKIVFSTKFNTNYEVNRPSRITKNQGVYELTKYWTHLVNGMFLKGVIHKTHPDRIEVSIAFLEKTCEDLYSKFVKQFNKNKR